MKNNEKFKKFMKFGLCAVILLATIVTSVFVVMQRNADDVNAAIIASGCSTSNQYCKYDVIVEEGTWDEANRTQYYTVYVEFYRTNNYTTTYDHYWYTYVNGGHVNTTECTTNFTSTRAKVAVYSGSIYYGSNSSASAEITVSMGGKYSSSFSASAQGGTMFFSYHAVPITTYWTNINVITPEGNEDTTTGASFDLYFSDEGSLRRGMTNEPVPAVYKSSGVTLTLYNITPKQDKYVIDRVDGATWNGFGYARTTNTGGTIYIYLAYKKSTISFDSNTTDTVSDMPSSVIKTGGTNLTLPTIIPQRTGYDFQCWSTSTDGNGTNYTAGGTFSSDKGDTTLYAIWKPSEYTVTLDANGGLLENTNHRVDSSRDVLANIAGRTFYKAYDGEAYVAYLYNSWGTTPILVSTDKNAVAHFDSYDSSTIHDYDSTSAYGGTLEYNGVTYYYLTSIHLMQGDYTDSSNLGRLKLTSTDYESAVIELLETVLEPVSTTTKTVTYLQTYGELPTPTREGHTFVGWYYDDIEITSDTAVDIILEDHTLVAMWTRNYYNVTYHAMGGEFEDGTDETVKAVLYGDEIDLTLMPTKDGKAFIGWSLVEEEPTCIMQMIMPAEEVHLYAVFSLPVSDVKEVILHSLNVNDPSVYNSFPMECVGSDLNGYYYSIEGVNLLEGLSYTADALGNVKDISVWIYVYDNAGNLTTIPVFLTYQSVNGSPIPGEITVVTKPNVPEAHLQTVNHYVKTPNGDWEFRVSTTDLVYEGTAYTPDFMSTDDEKYAEYLAGYIADHLDPSGEYVVTGPNTINAYYVPNVYTLYFDPNGGVCDTESKEVTPGQPYGALPVPTREGYDFLGWFTETESGTQIKDSDIFEGSSDMTVYAHWERHSHTVMYDYKTNGGNRVDAEYIDFYYGDPVNLDNQAYKDGWEFIGWNTDPNAKEGFEELTMGDNDIVLYAIYKKVITVTYIDSSDWGTQTRSDTQTIYNTTQYAEFLVPEQNTMSRWECLGWSLSTEADAEISYSSNTTIQVSESQTLYGCYRTEVTLSYDMNGSPEVRDSVTKESYFNASGEYKYPKFEVASSPKRDGYAFKYWYYMSTADHSTHTYQGGEVIEIPYDTVLTAEWDKIPELSAYNRYFTLSEAQNGEITVERLLEKVVGTDLEDGTLENGTAVTIPGYQPEDFTSFVSDGSVTVTYQATDSFGNTVTKTVTVYIVDTTSTEANKKDYIRFISSEFYLNEDGSYVSKENGGLEDRSLWTTDVAYAEVLTNALTNSKIGTDKSEVKVLSKTYEIEQPGSGDWKRGVMSYKFTKSQIGEVKEHLKDNGYAKYSSTTGIQEFIEKFKDCITIW